MITPTAMVQAMDWTYALGLEGVSGSRPIVDLVESYRNESFPVEAQLNSFVRYQVLKCGASGFVTGLGGFLSLPVAVPINITSVLYVQLRMIAGVAHLRGYDVFDDRVKTICYACLCGRTASEVVKEVGINLGSKVATNSINKISGKTIARINEAVGFRLVTKFGNKGVVNLGKLVPIIGGVVSAGFDSVSTYSIGEIAKFAFTPKGGRF